ncbi:hypothetical protein [Persephonella sp. KM09-Lau-8]|uniref:hypothetical protein n=1 Tax=Persephonella sp. KM09-Lau-8 TaxID=1158345 RepID=UPI00049767A8|nr:hypothetical protein [Persephonella sp. KM09-Lau-8]
MIREKTTVEIIQEIQKALNKYNLPVKVDIAEAREGADIGLNIYVYKKRNWKLHDKINSVIQEVLEEEDLIPYINWHYEQN